MSIPQSQMVLLIITCKRNEQHGNRKDLRTGRHLSLPIECAIKPISSGYHGWRWRFRSVLRWSDCDSLVDASIQCVWVQRIPFDERNNFTRLTASSQSGVQYTDLGISNGSTYYYAVTAVNRSGESTRSSEVIATPVETVRQAPVLTAKNRDGFVFLSWVPDPLTTPQFGTAFNVKRSETPDGPYSTVIQINTYKPMTIQPFLDRPTTMS